MATKAYHPVFLKYQAFIVADPAYKGMPSPRNIDGAIVWIAAKKSSLGALRQKWWEAERAKLIRNKRVSPDAKISDVARAIHPTGIKPCQICGTQLSLQYIYLGRHVLNRIEKLSLRVELSELDSVENLFDKVAKKYPGTELSILSGLFEIPPGVVTNRSACIQFIEKERTTLLSPGAMSNPPDRFDGFHSYNRCCRQTEDKGRSTENMGRYGEDRRAYENWSDGDWKAASWLMREFSKHGVSADHIGPISLGFAHRPTFAPMTRAENSAKNNRMTYADIRRLVSEEHAGQTVISWHSKAIWDALKELPKNDEHAKFVSALMRTNMHHVLYLLAAIKEAGHEAFLKSLLNLEHAYYSIKIVGFTPSDGSYVRIVKTQGAKEQYSNNAVRYVRKAFSSLDEYLEKENRRQYNLNDDEIDSIVDLVTKQLHRTGEKSFSSAKEVLVKFLESLADKARLQFESHFQK